MADAVVHDVFVIGGGSMGAESPVMLPAAVILYFSLK